MLDTLLKYVSLITAFGAAIAFIVGLLKYLDQRRREDRTKRFELYHDLMRRISAFSEHEGAAVPMSQQVAAVYELQHFTDYAFASIPILEHLQSFYTQGHAAPVLLTAIEKTLDVLRTEKT